MAFIGQSLKISNLPQDTNSFAPLPAGWYSVYVKTAELKSTNAGDGSYINLRLIVDGPTHAGRSLWAKLNITNRNPKAEEIGRAQLRTICEIGGIEEISDTDQLVNLRMSVKVVDSKNFLTGEPDNEVKGFKALAGVAIMPAQFAAPAQPQAFAQQHQAPAAQPVQATQVTASAAPPWATPAATQSAPVPAASNAAPPWAAR